MGEDSYSEWRTARIDPDENGGKGGDIQYRVSEGDYPDFQFYMGFENLATYDDDSDTVTFGELALKAFEQEMED